MPDGEVIIEASVDSSGISAGLKKVDNATEASTKKVRKSIAQAAQESGKSVDEVKADVAKLARSYQTAGMSIPVSFKRAYDELGLMSDRAAKRQSDSAQGGAEAVVDSVETIISAHKAAADKIEEAANTSEDTQKESAEESARAHENAAEKTTSAWKKAYSKLGSIARSAGKIIAVGVGTGVAAIGKLISMSISADGELEQNLGGSKAVFDKFALEIQTSAKQAYSKMGLSTSAYLATANKMGALFKGAGFSIKQSMQLSQDLMQRAADIASIMGSNVVDAMEAVSGAAKGNFTMMDNLGVAMNETTLSSYALSKGIKKSTSKMSQQEKM